MKKIITGTSIILMLSFAFILTAATQQGKEKQQQGNSKYEKERKVNQNQGKVEKDKMNHGNNQQEEKYKENKGRNYDDNEGQGKEKVKLNQGNNGNNNSGKDKEHKNRDQNYYNSIYGYNWNNENFPDRKKARKQEKVSICHKISGGKDGVNIKVSENAVKAHLNHGDIIGACPTLKNRSYSDIFYNKRNDYYNSLQNTQEQVYYSQSILDFALAKLTNGRSRLLLMQKNNAPASIIETNQQNVVQLEQNVSLLETLIGVAVNVVANKL